LQLEHDALGQTAEPQDPAALGLSERRGRGGPQGPAPPAHTPPPRAGGAPAEGRDVQLRNRELGHGLRHPRGPSPPLAPAVPRLRMAETYNSISGSSGTDYATPAPSRSSSRRPYSGWYLPHR